MGGGGRRRPIKGTEICNYTSHCFPAPLSLLCSAGRYDLVIGYLWPEVNRLQMVVRFGGEGEGSSRGYHYPPLPLT